MLNVEIISTTSLGDRSYIAHDGEVAIVVDPQRDIDRVLDVVRRRGLRCVAVLETHIHNDYVSGGLELARRARSDYLVNIEDPVSFDRQGVADGERLVYGDLEVRVMATPGHTLTHLAYAVTDRSGEHDPAIFTGGSLLYGSVGRTDLVSPGLVDHLSRAQYRSARVLATLPGASRVFPTHGFGSFCSTGATSGATASTLEDELRGNQAFLATDEDRFVADLVAGLTAYPAYYRHMAPRNLSGAGPVDLSPPPSADAAELRRRLDAGEWVVDLRNRRAHARSHLRGSIGFEISDQLSTYLGWMIPWGTPLTLLGTSADEVAEAQRQLVRIGIDRPAAASVGDPQQWSLGDDLDGYAVGTFEELAAMTAQERAGVTVLDVRRDDEHAASTVRGATHIPLHELAGRLDEVPARPVWVHCQSGYRAAIAASVLTRAGHQVTLVDDSFDRAGPLGLRSA
ncbi:rhodanese-like domain-containing protein [Nocardioides sp. zg-DK7169]|uniref:MBL fold metallo-hydrolase n=1 Tax=Nocardioides sp. zg-DK7169 TaxID=2736600 RepID=UPI0015570039|nr:MBL fold metallo-hydrolase [Nocardioides sp. zg-DK7169]NPC96851.1 MBL fold metallo-hydrolase [Nocardioides sp. zg-DK7169]